MRSNLIGTVTMAACGVAALSTSAKAADFAYKAPYTVNAPLNMYSWAGPYIGGNLGYQWGAITNNPTRPNGIEGGVQGGYNFQYGQWVFGGEVDLQLSGATDKFAAWKFSNPWFGTVRGRAGYAMNNILFYGTAGLAFGGLNGQIFTLSESHITAGWTVGLGAEVGITQNLSAKLEYLYVNLAETPFTLTAVQNGYGFNVVRLGVNYRF
jgi:outer membrane immunogenic protein